MAGDWIKMRTDLAEDPAVISMAAALDLEDDAVVGKLHRLWSWADRQSRDGHAVGVTEMWVDRYVHCDGFASCLQSVGWLIVDDSGLHFPNFDRHNGKTAKQRALSTVRQQLHRANVTEDVTPTSRSERDKRVTREEKRREDISTADAVDKTQRKRSTFDATSIELPDWLDREAWASWCTDRKKRGKPITEAAARLQVKQLGEYLSAGHLPEAVIEHSIAGGFQGLYPPKVQQHANGSKPAESFRERDERLARERVAQFLGTAAPRNADAGVIDVESSFPRLEP